MTKEYKLILVTIAFAFTAFADAQQAKSIDYYTTIKNYNLSKLWHDDSIQNDGDTDKIAFPEPLGYIGENFQRFYIHYTSVAKSKANPYLYNVNGKTSVKNKVRHFSGTITILKAFLNKESDDKRFKEGAVVCEVSFYEDSSQGESGFIKGELTSDFYIDKKGEIYYDALMFVADRYSNNQCKATRTSYQTNQSKTCNWGDFRMPDSKELDIGVGEVVINEKFVKNGWESFVAAYSTDEMKAKNAIAIERAKWWER